MEEFPHSTNQALYFVKKRSYHTKDEEASQGWTALILDANGNGRRDECVESDEPVDPTKDKRMTKRSSENMGTHVQFG